MLGDKPSAPSQIWFVSPATVMPRGRQDSRVFEMGKGVLLWLIGIPIPIVLILWLLGVFH